MLIAADLVRQFLRDLAGNIGDHDIGCPECPKLRFHDRKSLACLRSIRKESSQILIDLYPADRQHAVHADQREHDKDRETGVNNAGRDHLHHVRPGLLHILFLKR